MTANRTPRVARWILEHAIPAQSWSESLSGDLAEQSGRRSPAWYWRQVVGAFVIGWTKEIYRLWIAIVFALLCSIPEPLFWIHSTQQGLYHRFFVWSVTLPWQWSFAVGLAMKLPYIWLGYVMYLALVELLFRSISLRRAMRGLVTVAWVYGVAQIPVTATLVHMTFTPINIKTASDVAVMLAPQMMLMRIPTILAMVCAIRKAVPADDRNSNLMIAS